MFKSFLYTHISRAVKGVHLHANTHMEGGSRLAVLVFTRRQHRKKRRKEELCSCREGSRYNFSKMLVTEDCSHCPLQGRGGNVWHLLTDRSPTEPEIAHSNSTQHTQSRYRTAVMQEGRTSADTAVHSQSEGWANPHGRLLPQLHLQG